VNQELSTERIARESAQREAAQARVETTQNGQRTKAALQAEVDQVGRTRDAVAKLAERERDVASERSRVRLADAGRHAAEEAAEALRQQLEGAQRSLVLYRTAAGEKAAGGDQATAQLAAVNQELTESAALAQYLSVDNDNLKREIAEVRSRLATSQEGDVEHALALAARTTEMDALHTIMRDAQRTAATATAELDLSKKQVAECLVVLQETKEKAAAVEVTLEAVSKARVKMEDELGVANAQLADLIRLLRELKASQKEQGGLNEDLVDARVALSAAREEVDTLRLQVSGFEQEARATMGGSLKAQKDSKAQLERACDELFIVYTTGRKSADGVEPAGKAPAHEGAALEAVQDALSNLHSHKKEWRDKAEALEEELTRKNQQARDAYAALLKEKSEAEERANQAELDAIRELEIVQEAASRLEGRVNRLRMELIANTTAIKDALNDADNCQLSSLSTLDAGTADDQDLYTSSKQHLVALGQMLGLIITDREMYANKYTELSSASTGDKAKIADLEVELRTIGEASDNVRRDREEAALGLKAAREALSGTQTRLAVAEARAQSADLLLNKLSKTIGTQAGPGVHEVKAKPVDEKKFSNEMEAIKPTSMEDGSIPEHIDRIIPREPPPPPRIKDGRSVQSSALPTRVVADSWREGDKSGGGASANTAAEAAEEQKCATVSSAFPRRMVSSGGASRRPRTANDTVSTDYLGCDNDGGVGEPDSFCSAQAHYLRGWGATWAEKPRTRPDPSPQSSVKRAGIPPFSSGGGTVSSTKSVQNSFSNSASNRLDLQHYFSSMHALPAAKPRQTRSSHHLLKASAQLVKPTPPHAATSPFGPSSQPQTYPPPTSGGMRSTMHTFPPRYELPMGLVQLDSP